MFKKTIISEFFTTVSFPIFVRTLWLLTYKFPIILYWSSIENIENKISSYMWTPDSKIYSFYNWRSALFHALKIIWVKADDEIIVSWYTCVSVSNAVIHSWAKIVYSDINKNDLWLNINELENNITKKTKVIIVQHTFWKASEVKDIIKIAKNNNILVIEDCAHSLWSSFDEKKLWSYWDFSIFSTGRDKVISWVSWGFLLINNKDFFSKAINVLSVLKMPWIILTIRNLWYNLVAYKAYKTYDFFKMWKIIIFLSRKLHIITEILSKDEKECNFKIFNYKLPNSLAFLASKEIEQLELITTHRRSIVEYYEKKLDNKHFKVLFKMWKKEKSNYFRCPILVKTEKKAEELYNYMRINNVLLWNSWSGSNIVPKWSDLAKAKYNIWSCPIAEDVSRRILLIPNHALISPNEAKNVTKLLNNFSIKNV